jgi:uncharacterized repeat protein (TIGR03803 family)
VVYSFTGNGANGDGASPSGSLAFDSAGNLYGTTVSGGQANSHCAQGCGTVFQLSPPAVPGGAWIESVLYRFGFGADGGLPEAGVAIDSIGNLYGTAQAGGMSDKGVVFELSPPSQPGAPWIETVLYSFQGGDDGAFPQGSLAFDMGGNAFGTTTGGGGAGCGGSGCGTVFEVSPPAQLGGEWTETVVHSFQGGDGEFPLSDLRIDSADQVVGTTAEGGASSLGVVFELRPPAQPGGDWEFSVLHNFAGGSFDGENPSAGLTLGQNHTLYGTTGAGGTANQGTIFQLQHSGCCQWEERVLYSFPGGPNGAVPQQTMLLLSGALYGTTAGGGNKDNAGLAFRGKRRTESGIQIEPQ